MFGVGWIIAALAPPATQFPDPFLIRSVFAATARARRSLLARMARDRERRGWRLIT